MDRISFAEYVLDETVFSGSLVSVSAKGETREMNRLYMSEWSGEVSSARSKLDSKFVYSFLTCSTRILIRFHFSLSNFLTSNCHLWFLKNERNDLSQVRPLETMLKWSMSPFENRSTFKTLDNRIGFP